MHGEMRTARPGGRGQDAFEVGGTHDAADHVACPLGDATGGTDRRPAQTDRRLRPVTGRLVSTAGPPRAFMGSGKPGGRAGRSLEAWGAGWNGVAGVSVVVWGWWACLGFCVDRA